MNDSNPNTEAAVNIPPDMQQATPIKEVAPNELQTPDEAAIQAVREAKIPPPQKKILGEFDSEEEAIKAFTTLKNFAQQQLAMEQQKAAMEEAQRRAAFERIQQLPTADRPVTDDEVQILKDYVQAVNEKQYDKALLVLKRGIEEKTARDAAVLAQAVVKQELERAVAPHRAKQQLLENQALSDLHPIADHAVWLAEHLGQLGIPKKTVAGFLREVGKQYAAHNFTRSAPGGQWEEPSNSWADLDGKDFDIAAEAFWNKQFGIK